MKCKLEFRSGPIKFWLQLHRKETAMDFDDLPVKKDTPLTAVEKEDLSTISADELTERVERLKAEIVRTETEIQAKQASKTAADAFFKS